MARGLVILLVVCFAGCTNEQLRRSTIHQAMTLNEIQHRQVIQNLATFAANPYAIPRQVTLKDGTAQITDSGSIVGQVISDSFLNLGASRAVTDLWNMEPVSNDVALKVLRIAYRRALGESDNLYTDGLANDLAHELKKQTYQVDDLRTTVGNSELMLSMSPSSSLKLQNLALGFTPAGDKQYGEKEKKTDPAAERANKVGAISRANAEEFRHSFDKVISGNSATIVYDSQPITLETIAILPFEIIQKENNSKKSQIVYRTCTPLAIELRRQVYETNKDLEEILPGWLGCSQDKHDVPKNACYVAYAEECGKGCYVWICPENMKEFEEFTLKIIGFSGLIKEPNVTGSAGVRFTPNNGAAGFMGR